MQNAEIRGRAWRIFKDNWPRFAAVGLIVSLLQQLVPMLTEGITGKEMPGWGATLYAVLLSPITDIGMTAVALGAWRRSAPEMGDLFSFVRSGRRLGAALGLSVLLGVLSASTLYAVLWPVFVLAASAVPLVAVLLGMALIALWIWLLLRLWLASAALVLDPEAGVFRAVATSWRASKRNLGRIVGMVLMVMWPIIILSVVSVLMGALSGLLSIVIGIVYLGYALTADAGLAQTLIQRVARPDQQGDAWTVEDPAPGPEDE